MAGFERTPDPDIPEVTQADLDRIWESVERQIREECAGEEPMPYTPESGHLKVVDEDFTAEDTPAPKT